MIHAIDRIDDPRIAVYRDLTRSRRPRSEEFVVEGRILVQRLRDSGFELVSVFSDEFHRELATAICGERTPIYVAPKALLQQIIGFKFHRGLMACGRRKPNPSVDRFIHQKTDRRCLVMVCDEIADPENLGGIIRNGVALGCDAVLLGPGCADPFSRRVLRVSMGTPFLMTPYESQDLFCDVQLLRDAGFRVVATMLAKEAIELAQCPRFQRVVLLLGNEGRGLSDRWKQLCDQAVKISMRREVDSLNVASSSAVFLHHFG